MVYLYHIQSYQFGNTAIVKSLETRHSCLNYFYVFFCFCLFNDSVEKFCTVTVCVYYVIFLVS